MTPMWVARERGLFKKHGLDMQYVLMPRIAAGDRGAGRRRNRRGDHRSGPSVNSVSSGADLIGIANFFQKLDYRLDTRPEIKKPEDLRGKRIAISGPGATSHLVSMLAFQGTESRPRSGEDFFSDDTGDRNEPALGAGERQ